jgi:hypothetical protein
MPDEVMLERIQNLAQLMRDKKSAGDKFVLMLGAGASLSSGVKPTKQIMQEIVEHYGRDYHDGSIEERFGELWRQSTPNDRRLFLNQYLNCRPKEGYGRLAELIKMGYFDIVVTFNFDRLLETALDEADFKGSTGYKSIIRGETDINAIAKLADAGEPRVKILKLHGSLWSSDYFLFSEDEMTNYPPQIASLLREITRHDIIICGYAFEDLCVAKAFDDSPDAGSVYYVNPSAPGTYIRGILIGRKSQKKVIGGDLGKFDDFFSALHGALAGPPPASLKPVPMQARQDNPFKFMDSYREADKEWFFGREDLTVKMREKIEKQEGKVFCIWGPAKIGKTSFIRAGLIPQIDAQQYECIYLRCRPGVEERLRRELERRFSVSFQGKDLDAVLSEVKAKTPKRILLFFDQFERVVHGCSGCDAEIEALVNFMTSLTRNSDQRLTPIFITLKELAFSGLLVEKLAEVVKDWKFEKMERLDVDVLRDVIQQLASKAGIKLNPQTVERLCKRYGEESNFTLAHVQTLCYYQVNGFSQDFGDYDALRNPGLSAALDSLTEDSNLMDLIDELSPEERALIRSLMKKICNPTASIKTVVEFMKKNFSNLIGKETFPESVAFGWAEKEFDRE